jgi:hypothetical protein
LNHVENIDLVDDLAPCTQLKELELHNCGFKSTSTPIQSHTPFLPTLKKLVISSCLRLSSDRVFQIAIPSLIELHLNCAHFGLLFANDLSWDVLSRRYPNLQVLSIRIPCKGLTLDVVRDIATQLLSSLKLIQLPVQMLKSDEEKQLADELIFELEELACPIRLKFVDYPFKFKALLPHVGICPFHNSNL